MSLYVYEATNKEGEIIRGEFEAVDKGQVVEYLERKNLIPVAIDEKGAVRKSGGLSFALFERITALDRIVFVRNLAASVRAGLSVVEALDILINDTDKNLMRNIMIQAKINLQNGQPLSATFSAYRKYFPVVFVGMIKAGEASGRLEHTLEELNHHLTREYGLIKKVKSALAYPVILMIASVGVIALLLIFILPRLIKTFKTSGVELPLVTKIMIKISEALTFSPILDVAVVFVSAWFFIYFRKTKIGRRLLLKIYFKLPIVSALMKKVALVRLTRTLGSLISAGLPITEALQLSADSASNDTYKNAILKSKEQIKSGTPLSKILEQYPKLFPRFLTSLILVGEKTGTLEHILKNFADFYDEDIDNTLKDLTTFLEPLLLLFMGLVIGAIAISILMPIYQLVGEFT